MIKAVATIGAVLVGLVAIVLVVGWLLPVAHVATRSATFRRAAADVYVVISNIEGYNSWWDGYDTRVEVIEQNAPTRFVTRIAEPREFGGTWTFELSEQSGVTTVTITERGEVYHPIFRVVSRFVFGHAGTMESYLAALQKHLGR